MCTPSHAYTDAKIIYGLAEKSDSLQGEAIIDHLVI